MIIPAGTLFKPTQNGMIITVLITTDHKTLVIIDAFSLLKMLINFRCYNL
jgi:hypothetical protein